jgi:hypothetical protein
MVSMRHGPAGEPVERFKATSGQVTGVAGLVIAAATVLYVAAAVHTLAGLRIALAAVVFGTVVWISQLRPRATAYVDTLVLHNMLRDTAIPLRLVDDAIVRQTLQVWVGDERHVCIGIGRSVRALTGHKPKARFLGQSKLEDLAEKADIPHPEQTAMPYATFVETRLADLAGYARKEPAGADGRAVRRAWAWPELTVLVVSSVAFVASLLL